MSAAVSEILDIEREIRYYNDITNFEYHSHGPYANQKLEHSDEIRIPINSQDVYSLPCRSFIIIEGEVVCKKSVTNDKGETSIQNATYKLISNAIGYLFDEIRYELAGIPVAKSRLVGITSTIKSLLLKNLFEKNMYHLAGFDRTGYTLANNKFSFCIPLKLLLPFFEDFKHVILNVKQELVLLRSSSDLNSIQSADAGSVTVNITLNKLIWKIPYIQLETHVRLKFLRILDTDRPLKIAFRKWETHEYPLLPRTKVHSWTIKTAAHSDIPKYVILAFQTNRKLLASADMSKFDFCDFHNLRVFINNHYYPYDSLQGRRELMYKFFIDFAGSYHNLPLNLENGNEISYDTYKKDTPIIVIDCSHQSEHLKLSADIRLEIEFDKEVPDSTSAFCILVSDNLVEYKPLTSIVREIQ